MLCMGSSRCKCACQLSQPSSALHHAGPGVKYVSEETFRAQIKLSGRHLISMYEACG